MKKTIAIITVMFMAITAVVAAPIWAIPVQDAAEDNTFNTYDEALGIAWVSFAENIPALSYQRWITPTFGYCLSVGGNYHSPDAYFERSRYEAAAFGQLQWALYTASNPVMESRLYTWVMGGVDAKNDPYYTNGADWLNGCCSAGFGFDITTFRHISFPLEFGYSLHGPHDFRIGMNGQVGMRYRY